MIIDTHAHLDSARFAKDLADVVQRAIDEGVSKIVAIGCDVESSRQTVRIAERFACVHAAVGVHPCYVMEIGSNDWLDDIAQLAAHPKVVAIGEIGLDYFHPPPKGTTWEEYKSRQADCFARQMNLAAALGRNIVVHQRSSYADSVAMVLAMGRSLRAQFHCFVNPWTDAEPLIAAGHVISFTGIATYPKAPEVLQCARDATPGDFMLETDCPYLTPQSHRGQRCEPAHVRSTAEEIALARGISLEMLAQETSRTAAAFFGIAC